MVAADGAVLGIVAIWQTAAPNGQTTSRNRGKVAAISAAAACGRRMLNDRGMERSPGTAAGTASGGQCAAKSASEWASNDCHFRRQPPSGGGPATHPAGCNGEPGVQRFRSTPHLRVADAITNFDESASIREAIGMSPCTDELKLVALDKDDIEVISAHVQDSLVKIADILWRPSEHRFVVALNRFDWMSAAEIAKVGKMSGAAAGAAAKQDYRRCRTALRFERVLACKCRNLDQTAKGAQLNLLAVEFAETDSPAGIVSLIFSGGGVIRLDVECLEAELADLGEVSTAAICPDHFAADTARV